MCSVLTAVLHSLLRRGFFFNNMALYIGTPFLDFRSPLLDIEMVYGDFNCTNNNFIGNQLGSIIIACDSGYASVHILNCTFQGNLLNASSVIAISGADMLVMDSLLIDNNTIPLTLADCISTFISHFHPVAVMLQGSYLVISNTTSNNHGTALGLSGISFIAHGIC